MCVKCLAQGECPVNKATGLVTAPAFACWDLESRIPLSAECKGWFLPFSMHSLGLAWASSLTGCGSVCLLAPDKDSDPDGESRTRSSPRGRRRFQNQR